MSARPPAPPPGAPPPPPPGATAAPPPAPLRPPPPYIDPSVLRPRRLWYWVAGAVGVIGLVPAIVVFIGLIDSLLETPAALPDAGELTISLEAGDERTVYEQVRDSSGRIETGAAPACAVTRVGAGPVPLSDANLTLRQGDDHYRALFDFEAPETGDYRVSCGGRAPSGGTGPLAIGDKIGITGRVLVFIAAFLGGFGLGLGIAIVTVIRRDSHKRRLQHEAMQR